MERRAEGGACRPDRGGGGSGAAAPGRRRPQEEPGTARQIDGRIVEALQHDDGDAAIRAAHRPGTEHAALLRELPQRHDRLHPGRGRGERPRRSPVPLARGAAAAPPGRYDHQARARRLERGRHHAGARVPPLPSQGAARPGDPRLPEALLRLLPDRADHRAVDDVLPRRRAQRQVDLHGPDLPRARRLRRHAVDRQLLWRAEARRRRGDARPRGWSRHRSRKPG